MTAVLVAPVWPNQVWFPQLLRSLVGSLAHLPPIQDIVTDPQGQNHPMVAAGRLPLAAWPVSGDPIALKDFQNGL